MEASHWLKAWSENRIGFHQKNVNKRMVGHWPSLELSQGAKVFVPLCGKSTDMLWIADQGHPVLGVDLSAKAAEAFFVDNELEYAVGERDGFEIYSSKNSAAAIEIWAGDFFNLTPDHLGQCGAYYDRAAMIAMDERLRATYSSHMAAVMRPDSRALLLVISYDQGKMKGPPFSVSDENVRKLLSEAFDICELEHYSGAHRLGNLADRGLETLDERVYLMKRN
ncbi:MAG: thiopurine S-methyltransferase [Granulosicoccus sp.]|jgi:thiopurine S-methyltransferase